MPETKIAIVTGGNRGIGFEVCRQLGKLGFHVVLTSRKKKRGKDAAKKLKKEGYSVKFKELDITDPESIRSFTKWARKKLEAVNVLVNNAGVFLDNPNESALSIDQKTIKKTLDTNFYGTFHLSQGIINLMINNGYGRVVNVSSGMGQLSNMNGGYLGYRVSKTAVNALTRILAEEVKGQNILINSVCPGWVKTRMGGENATRSTEEGADTITWLATLPEDGPSGGFVRDRKPIEW